MDNCFIHGFSTLINVISWADQNNVNILANIHGVKWNITLVITILSLYKLLEYDITVSTWYIEKDDRGFNFCVDPVHLAFWFWPIQHAMGTTFLCELLFFTNIKQWHFSHKIYYFHLPNLQLNNPQTVGWTNWSFAESLKRLDCKPWNQYTIVKPKSQWKLLEVWVYK